MSMDEFFEEPCIVNLSDLPEEDQRLLETLDKLLEEKKLLDPGKVKIKPRQVYWIF